MVLKISVLRSHPMTGVQGYHVPSLANVACTGNSLVSMKSEQVITSAGKKQSTHMRQIKNGVQGLFNLIPADTPSRQSHFWQCTKRMHKKDLPAYC
jgi:hypothetical protein